MTSSTSERAIRKARQAQADRTANERNVITDIMSTPSGRRWLWDLLSDAQVYIEDSSLEPYWMAYTKGLRNQGLRLLKTITSTCPNEYITMTRENTAVAIQEEPSDD